eukprot:CAMPEP_0118661726 /NCGR_PEP_ID=MMETSP0785-20121206/16445_1 /TAXON_ID=91992 /ORGANISM="Bolidomonas pacifica, Strain CCMP 1866" /LENGTH=193 /DNA_ID=CAMNT_0006555209 /DNA_START=171 /DNA_END=749 /DNA_ORIENTATION=+
MQVSEGAVQNDPGDTPENPSDIGTRMQKELVGSFVATDIDSWRGDISRFCPAGTCTTPGNLSLVAKKCAEAGTAGTGAMDLYIRGGTYKTHMWVRDGDWKEARYANADKVTFTGKWKETGFSFFPFCVRPWSWFFFASWAFPIFNCLYGCRGFACEKGKFIAEYNFKTCVLKLKWTQNGCGREDMKREEVAIW